MTQILCYSYSIHVPTIRKPMKKRPSASKNPAHLEPGVLQVFRIFILIQWGLISLGACLNLLDAGPAFTAATLVLWGNALLLIILLFWPWLQGTLGRLFLPLTLVLATLVPIASMHLERVIGSLTGEAVAPALDPGMLLILLLVPLLLVSMQYHFWIMALFILATSALDLALTGLLVAFIGNNPVQQIEENLIRSLLFFMIGFVVVRLSKAQRKQRQSLSEKNAALKQFAATRDRLVVSQERNRMARELHDTLSHTLTALTVQMSAAEILLENDPERAREILTRAQAMARDGAAETRRALTALRAQPLEDLGLRQALEKLVSHTAERSGIEIYLSLPESLPDLPEDITHHLYRVIEESLNNIVQHSQATQAKVSFIRKEGLTVEIHDNGKGFDPIESSRSQLGLKGMRERVRIMDGDIAVDTTSGPGTRIRIHLPEAHEGENP
jgi:signal transduction histidine kinase